MSLALSLSLSLSVSLSLYPPFKTRALTEHLVETLQDLVEPTSGTLNPKARNHTTKRTRVRGLGFYRVQGLGFRVSGPFDVH